MTDGFHRRHIDLLRSVDHPHPLDPDARVRIREQMLAALADAVDPSEPDLPEVDHPGAGSATTARTYVPAQLEDRRCSNPSGRRFRAWAVVATAIAAAVIGVLVLRPSTDGGRPVTVDVADESSPDPSGDDPAVLSEEEALAVEVQDFCRSGLGPLRAAILQWEAAPDAAGAQEMLIAELGDATSNLADVFLGAPGQAGRRRLDEVAALGGRIMTASATVDEGGTLSPGDVQALLDELDAELSLTSGDGAVCAL